MTKFKFDVTKTNEICSNIKRDLNEYNSKYENAILNINSAKNAWNGPDCEAVLKKVNDEYINFNDLSDALIQYNDTLCFFSNELGNIFANKGYRINNLKIYYDSSFIKSAINNLNSFSSRINNALYDFETCIVPADYEHLNDINDVFNSLYRFKDNINDLKNDINYVSGEVEKLVSNSKQKTYNVKFIEYSNENMVDDFWSVVSVMPDGDFNIKNTNAN